MKSLKLPVTEPKITIDEKRRRILAEVSIEGFLIPEGHPPIRNKFTRNMGYILDGLIRVALVSVYDEGGTSRNVSTNLGHLMRYYYGTTINDVYIGIPMFLQYGNGYTTPSVVDNNLATPDLHVPTRYVDVVEAEDSTTAIYAGRWTPDADKEYREVGLKHIVDTVAGYATLLARTVCPTPLVRSAYTTYFEGYALTFPSSFTRWFARALASTVCGHAVRHARGVTCVAQDGSTFVLRTPGAFYGSPDVMIGSNNAPPSPTDHNLKAPIASLANQTQSVEVDTTLQEVRIVRIGSYSPTTSVQFGEIGLFANLYGFRAGSGAGYKTLLVRATLDPPITLNPGTTYTLGIIIKLA